jgi:hypothetical protein
MVVFLWLIELADSHQTYGHLFVVSSALVDGDGTTPPGAIDSQIPPATKNTKSTRPDVRWTIHSPQPKKHISRLPKSFARSIFILLPPVPRQLSQNPEQLATSMKDVFYLQHIPAVSSRFWECYGIMHFTKEA